MREASPYMRAHRGHTFVIHVGGELVAAPGFAQLIQDLTLLTGIGGEPWGAAAQALSEQYGLPIRTHVIGPRQSIEDHAGEWASLREITDTGCLLVRPDHHVAWRAMAMTATPDADLGEALAAILGH